MLKYTGFLKCSTGKLWHNNFENSLNLYYLGVVVTLSLSSRSHRIVRKCIFLFCKMALGP